MQFKKYSALRQEGESKRNPWPGKMFSSFQNPGCWRRDWQFLSDEETRMQSLSVKQTGDQLYTNTVVGIYLQICGKWDKCSYYTNAQIHNAQTNIFFSRAQLCPQTIDMCVDNICCWAPLFLHQSVDNTCVPTSKTNFTELSIVAIMSVCVPPR